MSRAPAAESAFSISKEARESALNHARRRLILDAAWRVFARDGLDGSTIRAIATEAGCTTGAIYPLYSSKELIYADLLAESLERLYAAVQMAVRSAAGASAKLKAAALSFLSYYRDKPDEVALGLYLWRGLRPRGLTPELDSALNQRLENTLDLMRQPLRELGQLTNARARLEASMLFAFLIGALIVHQTGRLRMLDSDVDQIASEHIEALLSRLQSSHA